LAIPIIPNREVFFISSSLEPNELKPHHPKELAPFSLCES